MPYWDGESTGNLGEQEVLSQSVDIGDGINDRVREDWIAMDLSRGDDSSLLGNIGDGGIFSAEKDGIEGKNSNGDKVAGGCLQADPSLDDNGDEIEIGEDKEA